MLAALGIGIVQSEISLFQPDIAKAFGMSTPSLTGLAAAVPLAIILVFMIATGRSRLQRGETLARLPLPGSGRVSLLPLVVGVVMSVALLVGVDTWADALITTFAIAIILCSVVVVAGYAGQLSLCQFALAGLGAWMAARLDVGQRVAVRSRAASPRSIGHDVRRCGRRAARDPNARNEPRRRHARDRARCSTRSSSRTAP